MPTAKQTAAFYWRHAWRYPVRVIALFITVSAAVLTSGFLPPLIASSVLDRLSSGQFDRTNIWNTFGNDLLWYTGITFLGAVVLWRLSIYLIWSLEVRVMRDLSQEVYGHLLSMSANFHANRFGGSLVSQAGKLNGSYIRMADTTVFQLSTLILHFVFTAIVLWPKSPAFVIFLLVFAVVYMAVSTAVTKRIREKNAIEASAQNKQTGYLADAITNVMAIKSFAAEKFESLRFSEATAATKRATEDLMRTTISRENYFSIMTTTLNSLALALAIGSVMWFDADIATVFLIVSFTSLIMRSLWEFSTSTLRNYNRALGDSREMIEILTLQPEVKDPPRPEAPRITSGEIIFKDMIFAHADASKDDALFSQLNLHIAAGEKVGLVGHSGSGKTTLTKLLLRFADIDGGHIAIDGQNIAAISQDDLRRHIAYVPQEPLLFHRSIHENIAYGKPDATAAEIREAAKKAHAAEFIDTLPQGYETLVGERGVKLSGGQRQRIAIARAILKDAPILVLDEATSALDSESEKLIQAALWELMKGRTAIVIAHRLSTIQRMDRIVVLDHGTIIEQGTHNDLLAANGTYADLWAHQSGGFIEE